MAKVRKRKKDKEDEELAAWVAEIGGVVNYMNKVSSEEIEKKGELYLNQGRMIVEQSKPKEKPASEKTGATVEPIPEKQGAPENHTPESAEKTSSTLEPIPEDTKKLNSILESNPEKIDATLEPNSEKLNSAPEPNKIDAILEPIPEKTSSILEPIPEKIDAILEPIPEGLEKINAALAPNVSQDKALFELSSLVRFINGSMNILYAPGVDSRTKTFLIAILYESTLTGEKTIKIRSNDILKVLGIHKRIQKKIPEEAEKAGLAVFNVRKKGGTEVTFNEEIFNPSGKNGSIEIDRLIYTNNLSIYQKNNNEEKIKEKRRIPLLETGKYVMLISLHLADFPLNAVTGSLMEAIKGKDPELVTAFWIYAKASAGKIKSPGAYLIKVLKNNDTGSLSGEIMEKAKVCVKAAQTIVHETYDEPELAFLKNLAQKLSLTDAYYKDRMSLTAELKSAGRKLIDECEKILRKLPSVDN
jgi:hypothetical protein